MTQEGTQDPNVDRGWAWVIAVAVCIINIVTLGSIRCLGILVNYASVEFSINKRDSSVIFSVTYITFMMSTILFIGLTRVVSCRVVIFVGGLITACGLCLAYFLPTPTALASGTAVLFGLGLSASLNPAVLLLNQYFDLFRSRANGIAFAGGPIGSFLMPPLITHFMITYTFRGAMLLWGGLTLHICAVACLMQPKPPPPSPPPPPPSTPPPPQAVEARPAVSLKLSGPAFGASLDSIQVPYAEDDAETVVGEDEYSEASATETNAEAAAERPLTSSGTVKEANQPSAASRALACNSEIQRVLRLPLFYALGVVATLGLCGLALTFYIVPQYGGEIGLDTTTTSLFLLLQGVPDLVARLLAGFLTDKRLISHLRLVWLCLLMQSVVWFLLLAMPSYGGLLFFTVACGLFGGVVVALTHPLVISQLGLANYRVSFVVFSIVHGVWMLCLPILLGHIYDKTRSWRLAIAVIGVLLALAGTTGLVLDLTQSIRQISNRVVRRLWMGPRNHG